MSTLEIMETDKRTRINVALPADHIAESVQKRIQRLVIPFIRRVDAQGGIKGKQVRLKNQI